MADFSFPIVQPIHVIFGCKSSLDLNVKSQNHTVQMLTELIEQNEWV